MRCCPVPVLLITARSLLCRYVCCICKPARAWLMDNARILCTMTEPQLIFCFFGSWSVCFFLIARSMIRISKSMKSSICNVKVPIWHIPSHPVPFHVNLIFPLEKIFFLYIFFRRHLLIRSTSRERKTNIYIYPTLYILQHARRSKKRNTCADHTFVDIISKGTNLHPKPNPTK